MYKAAYSCQHEKIKLILLSSIMTKQNLQIDIDQLQQENQQQALAEASEILQYSSLNAQLT